LFQPPFLGSPKTWLTECFVTLDNNSFFLKTTFRTSLGVAIPKFPKISSPPSPRISDASSADAAAAAAAGCCSSARGFFCDVAHCAGIELCCALVAVHVRFKWRTSLRISVCRPRSRRWWPISKTCVCFACNCSFHYACRLTLFSQALRKWPLHPSSRPDDMKGPLTEHPVSLYGAADVGEGHHWRLLWFNVITILIPLLLLPYSCLTVFRPLAGSSRRPTAHHQSSALLASALATLCR
jgi:hypothetical protein